MTEVLVGLGSNIEPTLHVPQALRSLEEAFGALDVSPIYSCPAVGFSGSDFVNLVVAFSSDRKVEDVQAELRRIESACGRRRAVDSAGSSRSRTMDLDMLLYGDLVHDDGDIRLPRADILDYAFVLCPLADLRPDNLHPVRRQSYADLWATFDRSGQPLTRIVL